MIDERIERIDASLIKLIDLHQETQLQLKLLSDGLGMQTSRVQRLDEGLQHLGKKTETGLQRLGRLNRRIEGRLQRLDQRIESGLQRLDQRIEGGLERVDQKIDHGLQRLDQKTDRVLLKLDSIADTQKKINNELSDRIDDHERRIGELEGRR